MAPDDPRTPPPFGGHIPTQPGWPPPSPGSVPPASSPPASPIPPAPPAPPVPTGPVSPGLPVHPWAHAAPGHPGGPARPPSTGRRFALWLMLGSLALLSLVGAATVGWWLADGGSDHPDEWDPAVAGLAAFVEAEQGVEFDHPVHVDFLDTEAYRELAGGGASDDIADEADAMDGGGDDEIALYRALGLISGDPDLEAANQTLWADGTAAFYNGGTDRISVRGQPVDGELSLELQVVVVHELAHALQHQVVDLDVLYGDPDTAPTTEASDSLVAVLEGDASIVEGAFVEQLDPAQIEELSAAEDESISASETALDGAGVPEVLATMFSMPYQFGPSWVDVQRHGPDGVDLATMLGAGRPTTSQILGLVTGVDLPRPVDVDAPDLPEGADEVFTDTWGAFSWLVPLSSWVEPDLAVRAADLWAGDAVVVYEDADGRVCFDGVVALSSVEDARTFAEAVDGWVSQLPAASDATSELDGTEVSVRSCDPGAEAEFTPSHDAVATMAQLAIANSITASGIVEGVDADAARCFADGMIEEYGIDALQSEAIADAPDFEQRRAGLLESCGI